MSEILLSSIPLAQLEQSIAKIIEEKFQAYLLNLPSRKSSKKYATREEVAKLLHITLPTLNQLTKSGALTAYRIGRRVLYDIAEVESSLNEIVTTKYKRRA